MPDVNALPEITVKELAEHKQGAPEVWFACLGYVVRLKKSYFMSANKGRDNTSRYLRHFNHMSMDDTDDK